VIVKQNVESVIAQIGWHGPSIGKDDASTYAADVFSYIVQQPNSRFQRALIDSGLAVSAAFIITRSATSDRSASRSSLRPTKSSPRSTLYIKKSRSLTIRIIIRTPNLPTPKLCSKPKICFAAKNSANTRTLWVSGGLRPEWIIIAVIIKICAPSRATTSKNTFRHIFRANRASASP
jgi:hypothetical protein